MAVFPEIPVRTPITVKLMEINLVRHAAGDPVCTYRLVVEMDDDTTAAIQGELQSVLPEARYDTVLNWLDNVYAQAVAEVIPGA